MPPSHALLPALALAAVAVAPAPARAQSGPGDADEPARPWVEVEATPPAYPQDGNLIPFEASGATPHRFYIDAPSLATGGDGVVRYTLVVRAAGGATNVTFEGIRCATSEWKLYAVGQRGGRWTAARDPQWRKIEKKDFNRQHATLYGDFFCRDPQRPATPTGILDSLRRESAGLR